MTIAPTLDTTLKGSVDARPMRVVAAGFTDVGRRRAQNEDAYLIAHVERSLALDATNLPSVSLPAATPEGTLLVVADGMGGEGSGDVASGLAIESVVASLQTFLPFVDRKMAAKSSHAPLNDVRAALDTAMVVGDEDVFRAAGRGGNSPTMGTTLTLAYLLFPVLYVAHVGDSRCYLYRGGSLEQLTHDHTLAEEMARAGEERVPDEYKDMLSNALGGGRTGVHPEVSKFGIQRGDCVLLCSDGLSKQLTAQEIAREIERNASPRDRCRRLTMLANERGGVDNTTVVIAAVQ